MSLIRLQESLSRDLAWRKQEIGGLKIAARRSGSDRLHVFRAGLVLLCAHWEGFLRSSIGAYVEHVFSQKPRLAELTPAFLAIALYTDVMEAGKADYPGSEFHHIKLAIRLSSGLDEECSKSGWKPKTQGNPGTETFTKLMQSVGLAPDLGLDGAAWAATKVFIDEQIVRDRHHIAHGEGFRVSKEEFLDRSNRLLGLLDRLSSNILEAAEARAFVLH